MKTVSSIRGLIMLLHVVMCVASHRISAQCSLKVDLGDDIKVCSRDRDIQLSADVDGEVLDLSWNRPEDLDNPLTLTPRVMVGPSTDVNFGIEVSGFHESDNMLTNPDFEDGDVGFSSMYAGASNNPGGYLIDTIGTALYDEAKPCRDRTTPMGKMMLVKVSQVEEVPIWCQEVTVDPSKDYHFRGLATGLRTNFPPVLVLKINDIVVSSGTLGSFACSWQSIRGDWAADGAATAKICIHVSPDDVGKDPDFALDDLGFFEVCAVTDQQRFQSFPLAVGGKTLVEMPCGGTTELNPTIVGPSEDILYRWRTNVGNFGSDHFSPDLFVNRSGYYELAIGWTDGDLVCFDTLGVTVISSLDESIDIEQRQSGTCDEPLIDLLAVNVPPVDHLSYQWKALNGSLTGDTTREEATTSAAGRFELKVLDTLRQCSTVRIKDVAVDLLPKPQIQLSAFSCTSPYRDVEIVTPVGPYTYALDTSSFQSDTRFLDVSSGLHVVMVKDLGGCIGRDSIVVPFSNPIEVSTASPYLLPGGAGIVKANLNMDADSVSNIHWSPAHLVSCIDCLDPKVRVEQPEELTLIVTDINACSDTASVLVKPVSDTPLFVPNAFTPNGDGINDRLKFESNERVVRFVEILVVDRWGGVVYQGKDLPPGASWDGHLEGQSLPSGTYIYSTKILLADGRKKRYNGTVSLIR